MASAASIRPVRPANRRAIIAAVAGRAFAERGYHAVSMDDIAAEVGITAAALYRHFPNKYALFVECAHQLADGLAAALAGVPATASLDDLLRVVASATVSHRDNGGIHRWEARYLTGPDRAALRAIFTGIVDRVADAVAAARPDGANLPCADRRLLAAAALGAIGSATAHRTTIGVRRLERLLVGAATRVARAEVDGSVGKAPPDERSAPAASPARGAVPRRQQILDAAVPLFHRDGYAEVAMADIAASVGITTSGLYRHYAGKAAILHAACMHAAEVLDAAVRCGVDAASDPQDRLRAYTHAYVAYAFEHTALTSVATAESGGLPPEFRRPIITAQREFVGSWAQHLREARPGMGSTEARVLVHAGLGVVTEAGRAVRWADTPGHRARVVDLVLAALESYA